MSQVRQSIKYLDRRIRRCGYIAPTVRSFAKLKLDGIYLIETTDHVLAIIDGYVCDRPEVSDLIRIQQAYKIT